jgi:hypothetical protein
MPEQTTPEIATDADPRNLGPQPIATVMETRGLEAKDLVAASTEQITHKMVQRACKGRRLSPHVMTKVVNALNAAAKAEHQYTYADLFNYRAGSSPRG